MRLPDVWKLIWTEQSIKDFYLNNILIHELGHLLDDRNSRARSTGSGSPNGSPWSMATSRRSAASRSREEARPPAAWVEGARVSGD